MHAFVMFEGCSSRWSNCKHCSETEGCWEQQCMPQYSIDVNNLESGCQGMSSFCYMSSSLVVDEDHSVFARIRICSFFFVTNYCNQAFSLRSPKCTGTLMRTTCWHDSALSRVRFQMRCRITHLFD